MAIILASASPRRRELMNFITSDFTVKVSEAEEVVARGLTPDETVISLALQKAEAVAPCAKPSDVIISADTVVYINGRILGKPHSPEEAFGMLSELSGSTHTVYTGVCIKTPDAQVTFSEETPVEFYPLSEKEISAYIASGEPFDKAGGYGIQGKGALLVKGIKGDFYNVMGFPIGRVNRELVKLNVI